MPTQNVNLPDHQTKFIRQTVKRGRFKNASEVVRAGLRLLEQHEAEDKARLKTLRRIAREGFEALDRGEYTTYTPKTLDRLFEKIDRKLRSAS